MVYIDVYMYIWYSPLKDSLKLAIERWPEWDLSPQPLKSVKKL